MPVYKKINPDHTYSIDSLRRHAIAHPDFTASQRSPDTPEELRKERAMDLLSQYDDGINRANANRPIDLSQYQKGTNGVNAGEIHPGIEGHYRGQTNSFMNYHTPQTENSMDHDSQETSTFDTWHQHKDSSDLMDSGNFEPLMSSFTSTDTNSMPIQVPSSGEGLQSARNLAEMLVLTMLLHIHVCCVFLPRISCL